MDATLSAARLQRAHHEEIRAVSKIRASINPRLACKKAIFVAVVRGDRSAADRNIRGGLSRFADGAGER
jgi:hypothetical protein